ncbi:Holliday junction branch migration protein RuvA [Candidatus Bipolaricaulota bacterium]|nr:Holliday junction branch migration protein RuvA [Candidatus Bipolaricaulota bacterium]
MIDAIRGDIVDVGTDYVCIETGGITYQIFCPAETVRACHERLTDQVFTHLIVRDDSIQLYGFASTDAREVFRKLLTVGQIGPKLALQILSSLPTEALVEAIMSNDVTRLTTIKGIGEKTAQRILLDLRDKIGGSTDGFKNLFLVPEEETALQALTSKALGFSMREARQAIVQLRDKKLNAEGLVREALSLLGRNR